MPYDDHCLSCPYFLQQHLSAGLLTSREFPPVGLESRGSSTLLLFQAPGDIEWTVGSAIQPTIKRGGTAGARVLASWLRRGRAREDFDIINAVQCFPGKDQGRDFKPLPGAVLHCSRRLAEIVKQRDYSRIIVFGDIALQVANSLVLNPTVNARLIPAPHPNGGVLNATLDSLW